MLGRPPNQIQVKWDVRKEAGNHGVRLTDDDGHSLNFADKDATVLGTLPLPSSGVTVWRVEVLESCRSVCPGVCSESFLGFHSRQPGTGKIFVIDGVVCNWFEREPKTKMVFKHAEHLKKCMANYRMLEWVYDGTARTLGFRIDGREVEPFPMVTDLPDEPLFPSVSGNSFSLASLPVLPNIIINAQRVALSETGIMSVRCMNLAGENVATLQCNPDQDVAEFKRALAAELQVQSCQLAILAQDRSEEEVFPDSALVADVFSSPALKRARHLSDEVCGGTQTDKLRTSDAESIAHSP